MANTIPAPASSSGVASAPTTTPNMIEVRQVSKLYGAVQAVNGVDLDIHPGEMFGLIGHNGAGKSTLFKMMLGLIPVSHGSICVQGVRTDSAGFRNVRRSIGYLPENVVLYDNLTGLETVQFFAQLKNVPVQACGAALEKVGLSAAADRRVHGYSKGMRQRLGFAQALLGKPRLMFLDEPTSGLDPEAIRAFYQILAELKADGVTLILSSHILAEIQQRVDRLAIMAAGKLRAVGTLQSLREQVHLPIRILATVPSGAAWQIIGQFEAPGIEIRRPRPDQVEISCAREHKMNIITRLTQLNEPVVDLHIHEPSLEDVFFGFAG